MNYLIVRVVALGDIAVSTTLLNRIRAEDPGARVTWLCGDAALDLVRMFPGVDDVIAVDQQALLRGSLAARAGTILGAWRALRRVERERGKFDRALILHMDRRYRVLTLPLASARVDALSAGRGPGHEGANPLLSRFRGDEYARLLDGPSHAGPITRRFPMADLRSAAGGADARSGARVALVPGGARNILREDALRRWPVESYRLLAQELLRLGCEVVLIGDRADEWVQPTFSGLGVRDEIGRLSIPETLRLLRGCDVVVSHDTGPLHFARLVRAPIVALFGPSDPQHMVGEDESITALWGGAHLPCRPCYDGLNYARCDNNLCMQSVTVPEVLAAVTERLQRGGALPRGAGVSAPAVAEARA